MRKFWTISLLTLSMSALAGCGSNPSPTPAPATGLTGISIAVAPNKVNYKVGEFFDPTGMSVMGSYSDGTFKDIVYYTYSPMEALTSLDSFITVSYGGFSAFQPITVGDAPGPTPSGVVRIKVKGKMSKQEYAYNDSWSETGYSVYAVSSGEVETLLSPSDYKIDFSPSKPSQYISTLTVTFTYAKDAKYKAIAYENDISVGIEPYDEAAEISSYYSDANLSLSGTSLLDELCRHTFAKHTKWINYKSVNDYKARTTSHESTDLIPGKSKIELSYTGKVGGYGEGSREHVWPAANSSGLWTHSASGLDDEEHYYGGGSDLYHVRPVTNDVNSKRGNSKFVDFDDYSYTTSTIGDGGPYVLRGYGDKTSKYDQYTLVEVDDHMKGDIARIIAYVYMHYKRSSSTPSEHSSKTSSSLSLTGVLGYSGEAKCKQKLIEWSNLDPVSEVEKYRNHTVGLIQGNRNPFVDHPELMSKALS